VVNVKITEICLADILNAEWNIQSEVNSFEISGRLADDIAHKSVSGAHWFRDAAAWFRLNHGYNNPLNAGRVHSELFHIYEHRDLLGKLVADKTLVFLGVGVGDTEMAVVDIQIDHVSTCECVLIDINPEFIHSFVRSLRNRKIENSYHIRYAAVRTFFDKLEEPPFQIVNSCYVSKALVCLGSTIGNYRNLREPMSLFSNLSKTRDCLLLGYQLNRNLKVLLQKYQENPLYRDLIGNFLPREERRRITWSLNEPECLIEAWLGDVQLFRSKKFASEEVTNAAEEHGWKEIFCMIDGWQNVCLHGFEKC
jgi:hypothetical protein